MTRDIASIKDKLNKQPVAKIKYASPITGCAPVEAQKGPESCRCVILTREFCQKILIRFSGVGLELSPPKCTNSLLRNLFKS